MDLCSGPILPKLIRFSLPLMLSSMLQLLFNAADVIVVGKFCGDVSLAAVGSNGSIFNLVVSLFLGMSVGANVLAARFFGAKSDTELSRAVHTSLLLSLISGIIITVIGVPLSDDFLRWMDTPENVLPLATLYLRIIFAGVSGSIVYNFGSAILRAIGDTRRPMIILIAAGAVNFVLNLIFVLVFHMDVAGVALATILSQILSAVLVLICLMREEGAIRFIPKKLSLDKSMLIQLIRIGLPAGLQSALFSVANVVIQSSINSFGDVTMSGNAAASNLESFVYMAMNAVYQAIISFTGQNMGCRNWKRIIKIQLVGQACVITVGLVMGTLLYLLGDKLLWIYSDTAEVVEAGLVRLAYVGRLYFLCGIMDCLVGTLRGVGASFVPMIVSLIGACGLRLAWVATVFQIPAYHTVGTVYAAFPISWIVTALAHLVCLVIVLRRLMKKYPQAEESL